MRFLFLLLGLAALLVCDTAHSEDFPVAQSGLQLWLDPNDASTLTVTPAGRVLEWRDKSPNGLVFKAVDEAHAPLLVSNGFANSAAIKFDGGEYLKACAADWANTSSGSVLTAVRFHTAFNVENFLLSTSDEDSDQRYMMVFTMNNNGTNRPGIRLRDSLTLDIKNGSIESAPGQLPSLELDQDYVWNTTSYGAGGGYSYDFRVNGKDALPTYNNNGLLCNTWFDDVPGRDNVILGGFETRLGVQSSENFFVGPMVVLSSAASESDNRAVEGWLNDMTQPVPEPGVLPCVIAGLLALAAAKLPLSRIPLWSNNRDDDNS